ncbi:hypothetical protein QJ48_01030 [Paenibacillus sp. A3]|uniref:hypothetical protein n=1 Tax=Paenibacillus sp. A3 TaxID=1337054 RepID=UPI0006D57E39|nr:hypothetical protein [Paenibacillus sp. A3]KPV61216.1 hypothetical protein QJ48_01030 [Paenibacillus sp. A3]
MIKEICAMLLVCLATWHQAAKATFYEEMKESPPKVEQQVRTHVLSNDEIAKKLLQEYKELVHELETNADSKDNQWRLIMAADKANGILNVYGDYLKDSDVDWVIENQKKLEGKLSSESPVYFGYSSSGIHVMAIRSSESGNQKYARLINSVRNDSNEAALLSTLLEEYNTAGFDVFVEDLTGSGTDPTMMIQSVKMEDGSIKKVAAPMTSISDELKAFLMKNNRMVEGNIKDKTWKMFLFDKHDRMEQIIFAHDNHYTFLENNNLELIELNERSRGSSEQSDY